MIWIKFCRVVDISDLITCANFGDDRLRGLGVAGVNFFLPHAFVVALIQHFRTTVRVCDKRADTDRQTDRQISLLQFIALLSGVGVKLSTGYPGPHYPSGNVSSNVNVCQKALSRGHTDHLAGDVFRFVILNFHLRPLPSKIIENC